MLLNAKIQHKIIKCKPAVEFVFCEGWVSVVFFMIYILLIFRELIFAAVVVLLRGKK